MSFLKKIWKGKERRRRCQEQNKDTNGGTSGELSSDGSGSAYEDGSGSEMGNDKDPSKKVVLEHRKMHRKSSQTPNRSRSNSPSPRPSPKRCSGTMTMEIKSSVSRHVAQVLPGLLLGSIEFAQDLYALQRHRVTHVLNISVEVENYFPDKFTYKRVAITDMPSIQLSCYFAEAFQFISKARSHGNCVLAHCYYGNSRSASFVLAYLIKTERMRYKEALEYLHLLRPGVHPNDGFAQQLRAYGEEQVRV